MKHSPSRLFALARFVSAGATAAFLGLFSGSPLLTESKAQTVEATPSTQPDPGAGSNSQASSTSLAPAMKADLARSNAGGRHLAPHDTFYLMKYVSVKTTTGVEGLVPGQEVRLVEVHRPTHTLVVTNGRVQVEVPPSDLTNDLDIAAMVRQQDEKNQSRIADYMQAEQAAFNQREKEAAEYTQKDIEHREEVRQQNIENALAAEKIRNEQQNAVPDAAAAEPVNSSDDPYYGDGGYGYGSPFAYFVAGAATAQRTNNPSPSVPAAAPAVRPNNVAAPTASGHNAPSTNPANVGSAGAAHPGPK